MIIILLLLLLLLALQCAVRTVALRSTPAPSVARLKPLTPFFNTFMSFCFLFRTLTWASLTMIFLAPEATTTTIEEVLLVATRTTPTTCST